MTINLLSGGVFSQCAGTVLLLLFLGAAGMYWRMGGMLAEWLFRRRRADD